MPLPKGINTPQVRGPWLAERRAKLAEFERLLGKGFTEKKAARALGLALNSVNAMRRSVEALEAGRQFGRSGGANIDLGLALLSCLRKPHESLTSHDIAAWCDCAPVSIQSIERRALRKVRQRLVQSVRDPALLEELEELLGSLGKEAP